MWVTRGSGRLMRRGQLAGALAAGAIGFTALLSLTAAGTASAAPAATCSQGSGPHLAGQKITAAKLAPYLGTSGLECADLAGSNLSGLTLVQFDLTGANLRKANLSNANLIQATMNGADLAGADLKSAKLGQADLTGANFSGAELQSANLDQATLP